MDLWLCKFLVQSTLTLADSFLLEWNSAEPKEKVLRFDFTIVLSLNSKRSQKV